jgi:hypothetical protein
MRYILYFVFIFNLTLFANDDGSNSYWSKAVANTESLWKTTKQLTNDGVDGAKNLTSNGLSKTKDIFSQGKKILLEKTLLTSINLALDYNNTIKVNKLSLDDTNGSTLVSMVVTLDGEDKPLQIVLKNFNWDVSEDKEFIILENLDISLDIAWLNYLIQEELKKNNGYLKLSYSFAKETFLQTLKQKTKTTYNFTEKEDKKENIIIVPSDIFVNNGDNILEDIAKKLSDGVFIQPIFIKQNGNEIEGHFGLLGSEKGLLLTIPYFDWATANEKKLIVLTNIDYNKSNKPWVVAVLQKHHKQILFQYDESLKEYLLTIKPKLEGNPH